MLPQNTGITVLEIDPSLTSASLSATKGTANSKS